MAVGGCTVRLYMNMDEVVAMASQKRREPAQLLRVEESNRDNMKGVWM